MHGLSLHTKPIPIVKSAGDVLPRFVEYAYYVLVFYAIMGPALGLSAGMVGAGMLAVLAAFCVMRLGAWAMTVYAPIALPLGCAISYLVVQLVLHGESLMGEYVRPFVTWSLALIVVQSLSLRQGFLHRFALAAFVIALTFLPYMRVFGASFEFERAGLERTVGYANPNDLAAWFGFCSVYFTIVGMETRRNIVCMASWLVAAGCLYIVGLTVSRGSLFAVAIATVVSLRRLLKRGFLPILLLTALSWTIYELGLFERVVASYAARGTEETGRLLVWPLALKRLLSSPLVGVGASKLATYVPGSGRPIQPHNSFLFIALGSGIIPLAFFVAYWIRAAWMAFRSNVARLGDAPFRIPLLIYGLLIVLVHDTAFTFPWMVVTFSTAMAVGAHHRVRRIVVRRSGRGRTTRVLGTPGAKPDMLLRGITTTVIH